MHLLHPGAHDGLAAEQDRQRQPFPVQGRRRADDLGLLALGKDDAPRRGLGLAEDDAHRFATAHQPSRQLFLVLGDIDGAARDACGHRCLGHRRRLPQRHAGIDRLRDDVVAPEGEALEVVRSEHHVGHLFLRERGERAGGSDLHLVVDRTGPHVQRAAEDEREPEHVVDLVGEVGPSRGDDGVRPGSLRLVVRDLRVRVGHGADERLLGHGLHHLARHDVGGGQPDEDVGAAHRVGQRAAVGLGGEARLVGVHPFRAALVDDALRVDQDDVDAVHAELDEQLAAGDRRRARAADHDAHVLDALPGDLEGVHQPGPGDDRRAVLVIMEHRDVHDLLQLLLDVEALRRLDVLEIDAPERRLHRLHDADDLVGIGGVQLDVEHVDVGEALEEQALALHHRFAGQGAQVAEAQDRGAVADHRDEVPAGGVFERLQRVFVDLPHRFGDPRRVGQGEITLGGAGLGQGDFDLAGSASRMVFKGFLTQAHRFPPWKRGYPRSA